MKMYTHVHKLRVTKDMKNLPFQAKKTGTACLTNKTGSYIMRIRSLRTPHIADNRTRQTSGFFAPVTSVTGKPQTFNGWDERQNKIPDLSGNMPSTLCGVLNHPDRLSMVGRLEFKKSHIGDSTMNQNTQTDQLSIILAELTLAMTMAQVSLAQLIECENDSTRLNSAKALSMLDSCQSKFANMGVVA